VANQLFQGYLYNDVGDAIVGATVNLYDINTTTPVRATTTTDATGLWTISHATEGRFDVEIVNGSSKRRIKYADQVQLDTIEVANFRVRNPADTFDYDIVPAAITADRQLNLPLITATDTLAALALAQTFLTGVKTFNSSILAIRNPADTFSYTIVASAIAAARNLTLPLITADDTVMVLGLAQTMSAAGTALAISNNLNVNGGEVATNLAASSLVVKVSASIQRVAAEPGINVERAQGTFAAPTDLTNGLAIGKYVFVGRFNSIRDELAMIEAVYTGNGLTQTARLDFLTGNAGIPGVRLSIAANGDLTPADGANIILNATTGMKIGTATTQTLGV
jgi:hypothetical protein